MSIDDHKKILNMINNNENKDTIPNRIEFVKTLLQNNKLNPIIDFDNADTENFINRAKKDDESGESYDTRITLKKKVYDITDVINTMGGILKYIKSGTTGHTFKGEMKDEKTGEILYEYAVKVVAYAIKDKYGDMHDTRRPENAELLMIKLLSYFIIKKRTPHIVLPIGTFDTSIKHFTNLIEQGYVSKSNERYKDFVNGYNNGEYYDEVSILISEWANRGDFLEFIKRRFKKFMPIHWKVFFFQLISVLAVIQSKFPSFRHNDLKANNILVTKINKNVDVFKYKVVGTVYRVPNIGYQLKIWDFDFACIPGVVDNKKVMISNKWSRGINVGPVQNRYYDIHYFFNTLIKPGFFPRLLTDYRIPQEVKDFVLSIVPSEHQSGDCVAEKGRILHNVEYTTPAEILRTSNYFKDFRETSEKKNRPKHDPMIDNFLRTRNIAKSRTNTRTKSNAKPQSKSKSKSKSRSRSRSRSNKKSVPDRKKKSTSKSKIRLNKNNRIKLDDINLDQILMGMK